VRSGKERHARGEELKRKKERQEEKRVTWNSKLPALVHFISSASSLKHCSSMEIRNWLLSPSRIRQL
jgi:hypothetical protein